MSKQQITYSVCFCFKRRFRLKEAEIPRDIKELFESYSDVNGAMNADGLHRFLREVQGEEKLTQEEAEGVMESFLHEHKHLNIFNRKTLYIKEFFRFLLSESNSPLPSPPNKVSFVSMHVACIFMFFVEFLQDHVWFCFCKRFEKDHSLFVDVLGDF